MRGDERSRAAAREEIHARRASLAERLASGPVLLLDGAMGTELERRGLPCELPLWSAQALLDAPSLVERIHRDYVAAGAEIVTTNSFRTQRRTLARAGLASRAMELTTTSVSIARRAAGADSESLLPADATPVFVAGSAAPLEDCFRPDLVPPGDDLAREHEEHIRTLDAAGADLILVETMNCVREAVAALEAAGRVGVPAVVSFTCAAEARLRSGERLAAALRAVAPLAPWAVLVNCAPPSVVGACLPVLADCGLPFGVYPNLGAPSEEAAHAREEWLSPSAFADLAAAWVAAGARLVGGCCGTTPAHIRGAALRLRTRAGTPDA